MEKNLKNKTAHSNFRKGMDDYNDGGENLTHYLGNDDYDRVLMPDPNDEKVNKKLDGKEAEGNDLDEDEDS